MSAPCRDTAAPQRPAGPQSLLLIVAGIGGEPAYSDAFLHAATAMADAAEHRAGVPPGNITVLVEDPARDPGHIDGKSTREEVECSLSALARRADSSDAVLVLLIGHGSAQGGESRFNLPGPDVSGSDLARLLAAFRSQRVALVDASSASGDLMQELAAPGRVIITATRSGLEGNATTFARHFVDAYAGEGADVDKDGRVSLLEAFSYAAREVARAYEQDNRLLTEHAQLSDNGHTFTTMDSLTRPGAAPLARSFYLVGAATTLSSAADSTLAALRARKQATEARIEALKQRKGDMDSASYDAQLESLLLELARTDQAIRALQVKQP